MPVRQQIFKNGERYPILLDDDGIPDFWVTLYVTEILRPSHTQASIINGITHLVHLRLWENINRRNLIDELSRSQFLSDQDIFSLRDHCLLDTRSLRDWYAKSNKSAVVKFAAASTVSMTPLNTVTRDHAANRLGQIASFLEFTARTVLRNQLSDQAIPEIINSMKSRILANKPKGSVGRGLSTDPDTKAPPPEVFDQFMSAVHEDSPDNPFKSPDVRFRNSLIFEVMRETGLRSGELLGVRVDDIDFHKGAIAIVRRHDAIEDPRPYQPVAKTRERNIPVKKALTARLKKYIMEVRAKIDHARKHPYLFVTHKHGKYYGAPISNSAFIERVLKTATQSYPELFGEIKRHGFRHDFNYRLSKKIDKVNEAAKSDPSIKIISPAQEAKDRMYLMGWVSPKTAEIYDLRHTKEEVSRLMKENMDILSEHIDKGGE